MSEIQNIKKGILDYIVKDLQVNDDILLQVVFLLDSLNQKQLLNLNVNNIYTSSYKTLIIDWVFNRNVFSIEIGNELIGWIIEVDGKDVDSKDFANIYEVKDEIINKLNSFLDIKNGTRSKIY